MPGRRVVCEAWAGCRGAGVVMWVLVPHGVAAGVSGCMPCLARVTLLLLPRYLTF